MTLAPDTQLDLLATKAPPLKHPIPIVFQPSLAASLRIGCRRRIVLMGAILAHRVVVIMQSVPVGTVPVTGRRSADRTAVMAVPMLGGMPVPVTLAQHRKHLA
jgi:hypothetical protein